ncbi:MAG: PorT family protein [Mariniphaga sp.]|nr:PorT family protein [Mariniphaga sp.]
MKKFILSLLFLVPSIALIAQPVLDFGIKAGVNNSKVTFKKSEFTSESIIKTHAGAFARVGFGNIYFQPEVYFSAKGGEVLESGPNISERVARFDLNHVDVPVLLGIKVIDGDMTNLRIMAGPVFSILASKNVEDHDNFTKQYLKDHYFGYQYGIGVDLWKFFLDARMEHGANNLYFQSNEGLNGKNQTFMVTVGFKIF